MATALRPPRDVLGKRVDLFAALYHYVSRDLRVYAKTLDASDRKWFEYLIHGFLGEFRRWNRAELSGYFGILHAKGVNRYVSLAGHAFLHIAYDLPRTIAESLADPRLNSGSAEEKNRRRLAYVAVSPRFPDIIVDFLDDQWLARHFGETKLGRSVIEQITYWAIALRTVAWVHAEVLHDNPAQRRNMEREILECLHRAARLATARGLKGIPAFHVMDTRAQYPLLFAWGLSDQTEVIITLTSTLVAAASVAYRWYQARRRSGRSTRADKPLAESLLQEVRALVDVMQAAVTTGRYRESLERVNARSDSIASTRAGDDEDDEVMRRIALFGSTLLEDVSRSLLGLNSVVIDRGLPSPSGRET